MIDTMVFAADLPADTYNAGDKITFKQIDGPAVVRDGLGLPTLKSINTGAFYSSSNGRVNARYKVKNSNWNDPLYNGPSSLADVNGLDEKSTGYQSGNNCPLQVNSAFEVEAEWFQDTTTTGPNTAFITIDIEYAGLTGVQDPRGEQGTPMSIVYNFDSVTPVTPGAVENAGWIDISFDKFKAGYRYLLQKVSLQVSEATAYGFVKFSGGASMGGLSRIIPITSASAAVGKVITYTAPEVKGPFTMSLLPCVPGAANPTVDLGVTCDYVKRG